MSNETVIRTSNTMSDIRREQRIAELRRNLQAIGALGMAYDLRDLEAGCPVVLDASAKCPLCGIEGPHPHTPLEQTIYRNGVKFGQAHTSETTEGYSQAYADQMRTALGTLLPGLVLDLRYADDDDDKDAMRSRIETVTQALLPPPVACGRCECVLGHEVWCNGLSQKSEGGGCGHCGEDHGT